MTDTIDARVTLIQRLRNRSESAGPEAADLLTALSEANQKQAALLDELIAWHGPTSSYHPTTISELIERAKELRVEKGEAVK